MSASKRLKTIRMRENYRDDNGKRSIYHRRLTPFVKQTELANNLRRDRIMSRGPIRSEGIPTEVLRGQSQKLSPRQIRNAKLKRTRELRKKRTKA